MLYLGCFISAEILYHKLSELMAHENILERKITPPFSFLFPPWLDSIPGPRNQRANTPVRLHRPSY